MQKALGSKNSAFAIVGVITLQPKAHQGRDKKMKRFISICICAILGSALLAATPVPEQGSIKPSPLYPVGALCTSTPPHGPIWVRATLHQRTGEDTFILRDSTGQVTLFLPTDELMALDLYQGMEILVFGTLDISLVKPEKNELYADRIYLPTRDR
jgi:uncharacterized protein YdeI (BOF family)